MRTGISKLLLLDVNVMLAIAWPNHQFHDAAVGAISARDLRWATCALTELGFIRLSSNPAVIPNAVRPSDAAAMLRALVADSGHVYLNELPSPVMGEFDSGWERLLGHQQVTDAYLLGMARRAGAVLATFDKRVASFAEAGGLVEVLGE
jgi:toxin-antitoxin system PIN domain toxin